MTRLTRRGTPWLRPRTPAPVSTGPLPAYEPGPWAAEWSALTHLVDVARRRRARRQVRGQMTLELKGHAR